jgi:hypothetical protein
VTSGLPAIGEWDQFSLSNAALKGTIAILWLIFISTVISTVSLRAASMKLGNERRMLA